MSKKIQKAVDEVGTLIDELSGKDEMSPQEAKEFYEELAASIDTRIEAIKCDLGEDD